MSPAFFASITNGYLPEPQASLLNGILLGIPLKTSKVFYEQLKIVGLVHLVVLSGSNISLLASIIGSITAGLGKKLALIISIITIVLFVLFVGPQPPIVRAACMGILALVAVIYGRKATALYSLILSAIFIAIFWPQWLTSISLQLSYGASLGLILFGKSNERKKETNGLLQYIKDELRTSLAAQVFTAPIILFHFKQISLISPFANILVSWLIAPLMVFGFMTMGLGSIHSALGLLPSYVCFTLLSWVIFVVEMLAKIPFASIRW